MENNLISMAKELEKLRAEIANADKGAGAAASGLNPGICLPSTFFSNLDLDSQGKHTRLGRGTLLRESKMRDKE